MADTLRLGLPLIEAAQTQKHVPLNEALARLDALTHLAVSSRGLSDPPASPDEGARWVVGPSPSGAWSGHAGEIAIFQNGGWLFASPVEGMFLRISDEDLTLLHDGSAWRPLPGATPEAAFERLGLGGSTADATNRLSVSSPAVLFNHAGAGVQAKLNKAASADTASLLFQTNWSGRAEMGLNGSDAWSLKTSADGSAWVEAIRVAATTGALTLAQPLGLTQGGTGAGTAAAARTALGAAASTTALTALGGLTPAADRLGYFTSASAGALTPLTAAARALLDDADAPAMRTTLGAASSTELEAAAFGDLALPVSSGAYSGWSATLLPAGDPAIPAGSSGPVVQYVSPGTTGVLYVPVHPVLRNSADASLMAMRPGETCHARARIFLDAGAGETGLWFMGRNGAAASRDVQAAASSSTRGAWVEIGGRVTLSAADLVEGRFYLRPANIPTGGKVFLEFVEIRQLQGSRAAATIQRAADQLRSGPAEFGGHLTPTTDNAFNFGSASRRLGTLFAGTGAINTSDARMKHLAPDEELEALSRALADLPLHAWRWLDALALKGDRARLHVGPLAQDVEAALLAAGLDPDDHALFCRDYETEESPAPDASGAPLLDESGAPVTQRRRRRDASGEPVSRLGLRPDQLTFVLLA